MSTVTKECLSHIPRRGMRCLQGLLLFGPVLCVDAENIKKPKHIRNNP